MAFTKRLGLYDSVLAYDEVATLPSDRRVVLVDMTGVPGLRRRVHEVSPDVLRGESEVLDLLCDGLSDAVRNAVQAAAETVRGIQGVEVISSALPLRRRQLLSDRCA